MSDELELEQPQAEEVTTMEDTIRDTYRKLQAEPESVETEETAEETAQRVRDEKGRFAAKAAEPEAVEPVAEVPVEAPPVVARKAPSSWKKEAQELYANLPPEYQMLQEEIERREADFHRGIEGYRTKAQFAESMERVIAPYMQNIQTQGVTPDVAVQHLLSADNVLRNSQPEQKRAYFAQLAQAYGIDLTGISSQDAVMQPTISDPRIDMVINHLQQQEAQRKQAEEQTLNSEIQSFSEGKEHFEAVRNHMAGLLQSGVATTLQDAYDMAIYADPTIRAQVLAKQQAEAEAKRAEEAKARAEAARKAASTNIPRRGNLPPTKPQGSMEDTIRAEAARLGLIGG